MNYDLTVDILKYDMDIFYEIHVARIKQNRIILNEKCVQVNRYTSSVHVIKQVPISEYQQYNLYFTFIIYIFFKNHKHFPDPKIMF